MSDNFKTWIGNLAVAVLKPIVSIIPGVGGFLALAVSLSTTASEAATAMKDKLIAHTGIDIQQFYSTLETWLPVANSFLPVSEGFALLGAWMVLWSSMATYRLAKSYLWGAS